MASIHYADPVDLEPLVSVLGNAGSPAFAGELLAALVALTGASGIEAFTLAPNGGAVRLFSAGSLYAAAAPPRPPRDLPKHRTAIVWPVAAGVPLLLALDRSATCMLAVHVADSWTGRRRENICGCAHMVMTALHAHLRLAARQPARLPPMQIIEERFTRIHPGLSQREREVCARTVSGMTALAISIDLQISTTTVSTYRRRAYQRMGICSAYELLGSLLTSGPHVVNAPPPLARSIA